VIGAGVAASDAPVSIAGMPTPLPADLVHDPSPASDPTLDPVRLAAPPHGRRVHERPRGAGGGPDGRAARGARLARDAHPGDAGARLPVRRGGAAGGGGAVDAPRHRCRRYIPPRLEGDRLLGRGACDAKGIAAAMAAAAGRLRDEGVPVGLLFVVGEETAHDGAHAADARGPRVAPRARRSSTASPPRAGSR
jgi:hypothetical protein